MILKLYTYDQVELYRVATLDYGQRLLYLTHIL